MSLCHQWTEAYVFLRSSRKPMCLVMVNTITGIRTVILSHSPLMLIVINSSVNCECDTEELASAFNHRSKLCK